MRPLLSAAIQRKGAEAPHSKESDDQWRSPFVLSFPLTFPIQPRRQKRATSDSNVTHDDPNA